MKSLVVMTALILATLATACTGGPATPTTATYTEAQCIADGFPHAACWSNMLLKPQYALCIGTTVPEDQRQGGVVNVVWVNICVDQIVRVWCGQHNVGEPACSNIAYEGEKIGPYDAPPFLECAGGLYSCGGGDTQNNDPVSSVRRR